MVTAEAPKAGARLERYLVQRKEFKLWKKDIDLGVSYFKALVKAEERD